MLSPLELACLIFITIGGLITAYALAFPLAMGFLLGFIALLLMLAKRGIARSAITEGIVSGVKRTKEVIWILLLVGLLIPAWTASGTIPFLIHLGLSMINPAFFLSYCFIVTAIISMTLGSSTGSLSTIGLPLMGIGALLGISPSYIAGALVSGAFVGDRTSPLSSANQLLAGSTEVSMKAQGKALVPTSIGAFIFSVLVFMYLDQSVPRHQGRALDVGYSFSEWFHFHPLLLLPPLLLISAILCRVKTKYAFLLGITSGMLLGSFYQHVPFSMWQHYLLFGYDRTNISILHGKGLLHMGDLMIFIALTGAFNGVLERTKITQPYFQNVLGNSTSMAASTLRVALFGLGMAFISCNQTLPIMISGRNLLPHWSQRFEPDQLSRVIADTSLIFAGIIPWNMLAILCSTILGVPVMTYVPYAIFLWTLPVLTIVLSYVYDRAAGKRGTNQHAA